MKENSAPVRALVLAGGGAKGSYHVGVYRALQQLGWTPDIITGASVGALNGLLFTMGKVQEAEDIWRSMELHDVLELPSTTEKEALYNFFMDVVRSGGLACPVVSIQTDSLVLQFRQFGETVSIGIPGRTVPILSIHISPHLIVRRDKGEVQGRIVIERTGTVEIGNGMRERT